ncbi:MAG: head-tail connector protein [Alphaproteobacteria bacterium]|nr:head-tail connector protein [Alphaproteobacteria bacterium]
MQIFLKTPPLQEPLTLEEAKAYLRISIEQEDTFLYSLIASARAHVEELTGRSLLKQKWFMQIKPPYPQSSPLVKCAGKNLEIDLPRPPLMKIESVKTEGTSVSFTVDENKILLSSSLWNKAIRITYWAGYGETQDSLPPPLKTGVLMVLRSFYDNQPVDLSLLNPFRILRII